MVESSATLTVQSIHFSSTKIHPSKTRYCPLETSLAFSTPPLHSIPLLPPFPASLFLQKAQLPCCFSICPSPASNQSRAPLSLGQLLLLLFPHENPCSIEVASGSGNVGGGTGGGRRLHGRDREGAAGPPRPHRQQGLRTHHAPPGVRPPDPLRLPWTVT